MLARQFGLSPARTELIISIFTPYEERLMRATFCILGRHWAILTYEEKMVEGRRMLLAALDP